MVLLVVLGIVACAIGVVWLGQGLGIIEGSSMSGHAIWAVIGAVLVILGLTLFRRAWRLHRTT